MNPPGPSGPDGRLPRLAGFADNELDAQTNKQVAEWIEADPAAAEALRDQEQFATSNIEFWRAVAPPQPSEATWEAVRQSAADRLMPSSLPARSPSGWKGSALFAAAAVALSLVVAWMVYDFLKPAAEDTNELPVVVQSRPKPQWVRGPQSNFAQMELAEPNEVRIAAIAGGLAASGIVADTQAIDSMQLAGPGDVELVKVQLGPTGVCPQCAEPGDVPIIYAAKPQPK